MKQFDRGCRTIDEILDFGETMGRYAISKTDEKRRAYSPGMGTGDGGTATGFKLVSGSGTGAGAATGT